MRIFLVIFFSLAVGLSKGQLGNEWINYGQQYYKVPIVNTGIYRLTHATLSAAGVPVSTILPSEYQIFGKEKEQSIAVEDGGDGSFDSGDYIEFFAEKNDGWLDSLLYKNPDHVGNPAYSLYNDTLVYFLTWNSGATKRMASYSNINFGSYTPVSYFLAETFVSLNTNYEQGQKWFGTSSSYFLEGEGWFASAKNAYASGSGSRIDVNLSVNNVYTGSGAPDAELYAISTSVNDQDTINLGINVNHHLQLQHRPVSSWVTLIDTLFHGYQLNRLTTYIPSSQLITPTTRVRHQLVGDLPLSSDYQTVSYVSLTYPHTMNMNGSTYSEITVPFNSLEDHTYLNLSNWGASNPIMYVLGDTIRRIVPTNNGTWDALIPNNPSGGPQHIVIVDGSQILSAIGISPVSSSGAFTDYVSLQLDSAYIILTHPSLWTSATAYGNYRSSMQGGSHAVMMMDINELYLQYGGGVNKHVLGITRALEDVYNNFPSKPKYLFLIGKSIIEATEGSDPGSRKNSSNYQKNLVPTYGYPPSDHLLGTHLDPADTSFVANIAVGRLAAHTPFDVDSYLNKMMDYELQQQTPLYTLQDKEWTKQVLHFSGGNSTGEQLLFQSYLNSYSSVIEDTCFGGETHLYAKSSSQPIDLVEFQEIQDQLENGVSLMTFFGHASPTGFDQNIDDPQNWNNQGKYPLLLGNSCHTGNIHSPLSISTSEDFVLVPDRGTIGFMSTSKLGFSGQLNVYSHELYEQFSKDNYGGPIGLSHINTSDSIYSDFGAGSNIIFFELTLTQMTLHGDPSLKLNSLAKPELIITEPKIFFEPETIDLTVDSITLNIVVTNIGKATDTPYNIDVIRHFPVNGADTTYNLFINGSHYKDTIKLKMPLVPSLSIGLNQFEIFVDQPSLIDEFDDFNNNIVTKNLQVDFDGIVPIWPYKYAIIPSDSAILKGSTVNPLANAQNYIFEIDTIDFEGAPSPFKRFQLVNSIGGVVEAMPSDWLLSSNGSSTPLTFSDSTVYFWRVTKDSTIKLWQESSFQYINGKTGWGQSHFHQFKNDDYLSVQYDRPNSLFNYQSSIRKLECTVYGNANNTFAYSNTLWSLDGNIDDGEYNLCGTTPTIYVAVIDPFQLKAWENNSDGSNPAFDFGDKTGCRPWRTEGYFVFPQSNASYLMALDSMLNFHIPDGHYVLVYTGRKTRYDWWDAYHPGLYQVFQNKGSVEIDTGKTDVPFILFWQQGNPASFQEVYGQAVNDTLTFADTLFSPNYVGNIYSELAGPAKSWDALHWQQHALEPLPNDSSRIRLNGVSLSGQSVELLDTLLSPQDSVINLSSFIDATQYPFAQLSVLLQDSITFTPAQIERWQLIYQPIPELAINPKKGFYFSNLTDTINEGEEIRFAMAVENVSPYDMDSVLVNYYLQGKNNLKYLDYPRQEPLLSGEVILDTVSVSTEGFGGVNSFWIEANPYLNGTIIQDQLEQYYFNNLGRVSFFAKEDNANPILDVTFDGIHILDGDLVSGRPEIVITLDDENQFLLLNEDSDTSNFSIWLTDPAGNLKKVHFTDGNGIETMRWVPANGTDNVFRIEYPGNFNMDGVYELRVQASDLSGNKSGDLDYAISFEVINASTITDVLNYPNPFSTRTQFVFTLTGNTLPDNMLIQIMTITGKVIREIPMEELGPLRIGRNRTEYWWDGTDQFGDPLANGVYLYRVFTRLNDEEIEKRETNASKYFKKGFGKMYLMR